MASVRPFRAYRFNPDVAPFDRVLTQPYDKISPAMQEKYYASDPHNLISIEKGRSFPEDMKENNVYTRAAKILNEWIADRAVIQDAAPAFYGYSQDYLLPGSSQRFTRRGFIGAGKLEDYASNIIFRHEHTLSGPKADRLELLRHTHTHTGQLFMLYSDPQLRVDNLLHEVESSETPVTLMTDEYGVTHKLWPITDHQRINTIQSAMADQKLVIADGHHRYETSLNFRNESRTRAGRMVPEADYEYSMMTFVNTRGEGLTILPTHRVVANLRDSSWSDIRRYLEPWFATQVFPFENDDQRTEAQANFLQVLRQQASRRAIGVYPATSSQRAFYVLTLRPQADLAQILPSASALQRQLDVVLLHQGILEPALGITPHAVASEANLTYEREAATALESVDKGAAQFAFLLNPVDVDLVMRVATAGEVMPQKSTDFYPKLLSGITMYRIEG